MERAVLTLCLRFVTFAILIMLSGAAFAAPGESIAVYGVLSDSPVFESGSKNFVAKGNVALLTSEGFLTGDRLTSQDDGKLITLEGSVFIVRKLEVIRASRLVLDRRTGEVLIYDVEITTDPSLDVKALVDKEMLGIQPEEVLFEAKRRSMLNDLEIELKNLREDYVRRKNIESILRTKESAPGNSSVDIERHYAIALRKYLNAKYEANIEFEALPPEEKARFEARRAAVSELVAANPDYMKRFAPGQPISGYSKVNARMVYRAADGKYQLIDAALTPCHCDQDSLPIFGLSARTGDVEMGGYAYLRGMTLDVATVPVAYTPWMIFPVKRDRESGFLRPYFYVSRAGRITGIPFFLTLGPYADATISFNDFSGRGQRYDLEGRFQLSPDSRLTVYGETIEDRKYQREARKVQSDLEVQIDKMAADPAADKEDLEALRAKRASIVERRWLAQGKWNVPLSEWYSVKAEAEAVSDSRYLSDYGKDDDSTSSLALLAPPQTAKRFLTQEAALEYYGSDVVLSARAQGARDLFSFRSDETLFRFPRLEFHLLPKRYLVPDLVTENLTSWERVVRPSGSKFADAYDASGSSVPDHLRERTEPILVGDRLASSLRITYPLPANDYINASAYVAPAYTNYAFADVPGASGGSPTQWYVLYGSDVSMPLFSEYSIRSSSERLRLARLRHDLVPSIALHYIPEISRDKNFPSEFQTFYDEDNAEVTQEVVFDITSAWSILGEGFSVGASPSPRLPQEQDPGVANETVLRMAAEARKYSVETSASGMRKFLSGQDGDVLIGDWAHSELEGYRRSSYSDDLNADLVWVGPQYFTKSNSWVSRPLTLGFRTSYNFYAEEAEKDINRRNNWRPGLPRTYVDPWGPLQFSVSTSSAPLLPITGTYSASWSVRWERWIKHQIGASTALPFGVTASISQSSSYTPTDVSLTEDRNFSYGVAYKPLSWLSFGHSWARQEKWIDGKLTRDKNLDSPEYQVSNTQIIALTNVQECLDLTIKRQKDFNEREWEATWSIGLNMVFFGQRTGELELGEAINRRLQEKSKQAF